MEKKMTIGELQTVCHEAARANGWWENFDKLEELVSGKHGSLIGDEYNAVAEAIVAQRSSKYALMHSELSEGLEGVRKPGKSDKIPSFSIEEEELADTIIRILDYSGKFGLRIEEAIQAKLEYNKSRGYKHGGKRV